MKAVTLSILLYLAWQSDLPGQSEASAKELMRKGENAMSVRLWEVAAHHYDTLLRFSELTTAQRINATMRLAEAMLRDGKPDQALQLLEQSLVANHPETSFWKGQALAVTGRFSQAKEILKSRLNQQSNSVLPYRLESGLTAASLELALAEPQEALKTLSLAAEGTGEQDLQRIRLRQIHILLDLNRIDEARELISPAEGISDTLQSEYEFTQAAIELREGKFTQCAERYRKLVENPGNLSLRQHHESWIAWVDALLALDKRSEAADLLLSYIQKYPESTQLEEFFKRLLIAMPVIPPPSDPILARLQTWIEPSEITELGLIPDRDGLAVSAWPRIIKLTDLSVFSMHARSIGLRRQGIETSKREAFLLLERLRLEAPTHFLASRSLLTQASWYLEDLQEEQARHLLITLRESATSPLVKGRAAFQQAHSIASAGGMPTEAVELYRQAAQLLQGVEADTALFNEALIQLIQADTIVDKPEDSSIQNPGIAANLELERALANTDPTRRQIAIESFLISHPDHARAPEARIGAAEAALLNSPPDISSAKAQIEVLEADPEKHAGVAPARIALVKLRILDLSGQTQEAITSGRILISDFPSSPESVEASFILGRKLYETGNYNNARIVFEKLVKSLEDSHRIQTAWLLAARSAALIPTNQSQQEALGLFEKAVVINGALSHMAKLEKARLMIDMNLLKETIAYLKPWYDSIQYDDPMRLASGLLLAEAIYAQGKLNPDALPQALSIYDQLIEATVRYSPEHDRLQYLRGLTLEKLPDPQLPDQNRDREALIAYYSVLERVNQPAQWEYFEAAGFRALALLEKSRRWPAAIACARKIASFKGPRAAEAAARANQIQLKYMIWED